MKSYFTNYLKFIHLIITIIFSLKFVSAHSGSIEGIVYSSETHQILEGAAVELQGNNLSTVTNSFGKFLIQDLPAGEYFLEVSFLGYASQAMNVIVNEGITSKIDIELSLTNISLSDVTIQPESFSQSNSIKALDIKLRPVETSQDALRFVPGLFIAQHAGGGKAEQIFLRGFDIDHGTDISINVDGIPVNMVSHAHGQGYADLHFLIPETVSSIDFQKGPYDIHYGDFATAGNVNFNTYDVLDNSTIKISAGEFNTLRTVLLLNLINQTSENRKQTAYMAGEFYLSDGPFEASQDFIRSNYFGKYKTIFDDDKILELTLSTFKSQWNASGQIPQRAIEENVISRFGAIDTTEGGNTGRTNVNLEYTKLIDNATIIKNQFYYSRYNFELYSNFTFYLNDSINGDEIKQKEKRNLYGYKGSIIKESEFAGINLTQDYGLGFRYDQTIASELSHVKERAIFLNPIALGDINQSDYYLYASETFHLSEKFTAEAAARIDYFSFAYTNALDTIYSYKQVNTGVPSFKLNFDYVLNNSLSMYFYSGSGFHSNDSRVVVPQNGIEILPSAYGSDLGFKIKPYSKLIVSPAIWILYLEQEFVYVGDEAVLEPSGRTLRKGIDLSLRWEILKWLFADADVNFTNAQSLDATEGENYIPLAPDFTSIGGLTIKMQNGFSGSFRYRYLDERPANEDGSVMAEGYFVNDLVLDYSNTKFEIGIEIQNLFNVEWNEAQFDTETRLKGEIAPVSELHFTPGVPFYAKLNLSYFF